MTEDDRELTARQRAVLDEMRPLLPDENAEPSLERTERMEKLLAFFEEHRAELAGALPGIDDSIATVREAAKTLRKAWTTIEAADREARDGLPPSEKIDEFLALLEAHSAELDKSDALIRAASPSDRARVRRLERKRFRPIVEALHRRAEEALGQGGLEVLRDRLAAEGLADRTPMIQALVDFGRELRYRKLTRRQRALLGEVKRLLPVTGTGPSVAKIEATERLVEFLVKHHDELLGATTNLDAHIAQLRESARNMRAAWDQAEEAKREQRRIERERARLRDEAEEAAGGIDALVGRRNAAIVAGDLDAARSLESLIHAVRARDARARKKRRR